VLFVFLYFLSLFSYLSLNLRTLSSFLDACAKLRKATVSFVMSVPPSVCPHGIIRLPLRGFWLNLIFDSFSKICWEN
jgi:hypothetical protein